LLWNDNDKVLGLNLSKVAIALEKNEMCAGLDYVSFSRVKRIEDVMILDNNLSMERLTRKSGKTKEELVTQKVEEKRLMSLEKTVDNM